MKENNPHLTAEAIADGAKSGLSKSDMQALGMFSLSSMEMYKKFGVSANGYAIPYNGNFSRAKILGEYKGPHDKKTRKYQQPVGTAPELYLPAILKGLTWQQVQKDVSIPLYITEGEKKAAAACKAGYPCIGLGGVFCFRTKETGFISDWQPFNFSGRTVYIVYDSDIVDKPQVRYAEYALSVELASRGALVLRIRLPSLKGNEKCGLDDFFVANGLPKNIKAAQKAFEQLPREKIDLALSPHITELGNAIRFEQAYNDHLRFVPELRKWIVFGKTLGLWREDNDGEAMRCAKMLPYALRKEAEKVKDDAIRKAYYAWAKLSESERNLTATLRLATTEAGLVLNYAQLDADAWKIAFGNGMAINLQTMQICAITPEDYFMKSLGAIYDPMAECPRWIQFINEIVNGDKELALYIQRVVGLCLTGDMSEQCFFILFGAGANGKSTFLNTLLALFGSYGRQASPQTFMANKQDSSTRSDLVRLMGVRLIATSETENNQRIAESLIKQWTGGEQISARDLYGKTFEFSPQGKILLATNHKPRIHSTDHAIWRRVHLIPFTQTFSEKKRDPDLTNKLMDELPGILNWALEGYKLWRQNRLQPPASVVASVNSYRNDMDAIGAWLQEQCEEGTEHKELIGTLFNNYKEWAKDAEEFLFNKRAFVQQMEERGFPKTQTTAKAFDGSSVKGRFLVGLRLAKGDLKKFEKR